MASAPSSPEPPSSPRGGVSRKRAFVDPEGFDAFLDKILDPAASSVTDEIRTEARKLQRKQEQSTIDLSGLQDFDLPKLSEPSKEPSAWVKESIARIRKHWHLSSMRTLIDVILLEVLHHLPADNALDVWGGDVYDSINYYILGPSSKECTPKRRYVIVAEAKNHLQDQDLLQAFTEMKLALKDNKDDLTVYGVLTDAKEWCILSLGPESVPRISTALLLGTDPESADAQLKRLVNVLYTVFVLAVTQVKN
jgi:hypothetical protein